MTRTWYTADLHVGHKLVSRLRGFNSTAEHDDHLAEIWHDLIGPKDIVYVLGDVAASNYAYALDVVSSLPGTKHLIAGNHDPVHPAHRRSFVAGFQEWSEVFRTISPFGRRRLAGHEVLLSHFPYADWGDGPDRDGSRYDQYRLPNMGTPLLHGHTHGTERAHGHSLHVGLDAWGLKPVDQEEVIEWLQARS